jgi:hypothetical protein
MTAQPPGFPRRPHGDPEKDHVSIQVDAFKLKVPHKPRKPEDIPQGPWREVWDRVHGFIKRTVVAIFQLPPVGLESVADMLRGLGAVPDAVAKRVEGTHDLSDASEAHEQERAQQRPSVALPAGEETDAATRRLEGVMEGFAQKGLVAEYRKYPDGTHVLSVTKPGDHSIAHALAASEAAAFALGPASVAGPGKDESLRRQLLTKAAALALSRLVAGDRVADIREEFGRKRAEQAADELDHAIADAVAVVLDALLAGEARTATKGLARILHSGETEHLRILAASVLSRTEIKRNHVVPALLSSACNDQNENVRRASLSALYRVNARGTKVASTLAELLAYVPEAEEAIILDVLANMGKGAKCAVPGISAMVKEGTSPNCARAVQVIGMIGPNHVSSLALLDIIENGHSSLVPSAFRWLRKIDPAVQAAIPAGALKDATYEKTRSALAKSIRNVLETQ